MKILVLGDIHGKTCWEDIVNSDNFDKIIFLGDYVSTHGPETAKQQLDNLSNILDWANKENANEERVVLLRGNHDIQHLGYSWAECSGWNYDVYDGMKNFKEKFLNSTKWAHLETINGKKYIFSHAGISNMWLTEILYKNKTINEITSDPIWIDKINNMDPNECFGFCPCRISDYSGESETQSLTWIRPTMLARCGIENYNQVVGHTPVKKSCINLYEYVPNMFNVPFDLWLCDGLDIESFMTIDDGVVNVNNF